MKKLIHDLTGEKFGRLTVLGVDDNGNRKTYYNCLCDCGNIKSVRGDSLLCGAIRSCGCLKKEQDSINLARDTHEQSHTRLYHTWQGMKRRCENPKDKRYCNYGGRGIKVCKEWHDFSVFYAWAVLNNYRDDLSIDRINVDGDYEPENCRWVTNKEQSNNRHTNINITIGNVTKTMTQWCELFQVDYSTVNARYHRNNDIPLEDLFKA